jgi:hypothetical protein
MKEPHIEEPATRDDRESCAVVREDGGEALTEHHQEAAGLTGHRLMLLRRLVRRKTSD